MADSARANSFIARLLDGETPSQRRRSSLYPSHPASTPASHRSARRPQPVRTSEGIWSQVPLVDIYASGWAEQSSRESGPLHRPKGGVSRYSSQPCLTKLCLFRKLLHLSTTQPNGILV